MQVEEEKDVIPPIPDPLGISSVDLRSIQAFYAQGRLMKSQTGQLARRASNATMLPLDGVAPMGGRKTSFRSSTTFVPYVNEDDDSNDDEDSDDDFADQAETVRPGFSETKGPDGDGDDDRPREGSDARGTLQKARSASALAREKK